MATFTHTELESRLRAAADAARIRVDESTLTAFLTDCFTTARGKTARVMVTDSYDIYQESFIEEQRYVARMNRIDRRLSR